MYRSSRVFYLQTEMYMYVYMHMELQVRDSFLVSVVLPCVVYNVIMYIVYYMYVAVCSCVG